MKTVDFHDGRDSPSPAESSLKVKSKILFSLEIQNYLKEKLQWVTILTKSFPYMQKESEVDTFIFVALCLIFAYIHS